MLYSMGESLECQICKKSATVHLTQIVSNKIHKVHLCEDCARDKGVTDPEGFSLEELFSKSGLVAESEGEEEGLVCRECGLSASDFRKNGRLGCPACYTHLGSLIVPILDNMHKGDAHRGKVPQRAMEMVSRSRLLSELEASLKTAVEEERYEDAAEIRDKLYQLRESISQTAET